ncbi:hypothetical protein K7432_001252 [Basidiobolus ranarum]|uniref:Uncharacterized protein n=1 Tax=Basidiobolus ranarum TaxID=34480 RepID=A0ABR2W9Y5_9FUNG
MSFSECKSILARCLDPNRKRRISIADVYKHLFLSNVPPISMPFFDPFESISLPREIDPQVLIEMSACLYQGETQIQLSLEMELELGEEDKNFPERVLVKRSPVTSLYELISRSLELLDAEESDDDDSTVGLQTRYINEASLFIYLNHCVVTFSNEKAPLLLTKMIQFLDQHQLAYILDAKSKLICQHSPSLTEAHWSLVEKKTFSAKIKLSEVPRTNKTAVVIKRLTGDKKQFRLFRGFIKSVLEQM